MVIDACFSGRSGDGEAIAKGLQPVLRVDDLKPPPKVLVYTAARSNQFAGPLPKLGRPAYSYLLLGGLLGWADQNKNGWVSSAELDHYPNATLQALLTDRSQTPMMTGDAKPKIAKSTGTPPPDVAEIVLSD